MKLDVFIYKFRSFGHYRHLNSILYYIFYIKMKLEASGIEWCIWNYAILNTPSIICLKYFRYMRNGQISQEIL